MRTPKNNEETARWNGRRTRWLRSPASPAASCGTTTRSAFSRQLERVLEACATTTNTRSYNCNAFCCFRTRLLAEKHRIDLQVRSVEATVTALEEGQSIMPRNMFEGFDHTKYDAEVRERWGGDAADRSNTWWSGLGPGGQAAFRQEAEDLNALWDA